MVVQTVSVSWTGQGVRRSPATSVKSSQFDKPEENTHFDRAWSEGRALAWPRCQVSDNQHNPQNMSKSSRGGGGCQEQISWQNFTVQ